MVFNSFMVLSVASWSADICQYIAFNPQRLSSHQVLDLLCCFPLQQLGRLALCLWTFFCYPHPEYYTDSSDTSDSDSSYDSDYLHSD
ncbi:hypothetical protein AMTRI_Chr03g46080 [Amborella trichopoda]|uniref:Uncharacterized protein n=1 Tax=Amborella trichopoda TaxID=13333 RepID=U5DCX1_AMBTC|nr:hypothetical protein AMTR_s00068p00056320 [Amborella trichopoda]